MTDNSVMINNINSLGEGLLHPCGTRNFTKVNEERVNYLAGLGTEALPYMKQYLEAPKTFDGLLEALFVVDKMADNKVYGIETLYPTLSRYNNSQCPEIQTMLSGIYRKTLVPDAFGPLCRMFYNQITSPPRGLFDPSEETGGAILEYLRSYGAVNSYSASSGSVQKNSPQNNLQKLDLLSRTYNFVPHSIQEYPSCGPLTKSCIQRQNFYAQPLGLKP